MRFPLGKIIFVQSLALLIATISLASEQDPFRHASRYVVYSPYPKYPYVARAERLEGAGIFRLLFNMQTGAVSTVQVIQSTGHKVLDKTAVETLQKWKFRTPLPFRGVNVPVRFELTDQMGRRNALRAARANAVIAPKVRYPMSAWFQGTGGSGRFEFIVNFETGEVQDVKLLETTSDARLDRRAIETFRKWRFRPHTTRTFTTTFSFY